MSEDFDALEAELQAMLPRQLPLDLRRRIDHALAADPQRNRFVAGWWLGGLVAAAACVTVAVSAWHFRSSRGTEVARNVRETHQLAKAGAPQATLGSYKLALVRSPDGLEALLDQEAARPLAANDSDVRAFKLLESISVP